MSKLTNRIITIPSEVEISQMEGKIFAQGPQGKNELNLNPNVEVIRDGNKISTTSTNLALAGTFNSLIFGLIEGVSKGYKVILEVKGVGYKVAHRDGKIELALGKSHLDYVPIPPDLQVAVENNKITITGVDKQKLHKFAANEIKILRPPSIYKKDRGIYYLGENIKLRAGKAKKTK
jgi:large subunit ribosomal protein L6